MLLALIVSGRFEGTELVLTELTLGIHIQIYLHKKSGENEI